MAGKRNAGRGGRKGTPEVGVVQCVRRGKRKINTLGPTVTATGRGRYKWPWEYVPAAARRRAQNAAIYFCLPTSFPFCARPPRLFWRCAIQHVVCGEKETQIYRCLVSCKVVIFIMYRLSAQLSKIPVYYSAHCFQQSTEILMTMAWCLINKI